MSWIIPSRISKNFLTKSIQSSNSLIVSHVLKLITDMIHHKIQNIVLLFMKDLLQLFTFKSYLQESSLVILIELLNQFWYYCKNSATSSTSTTTTMEKEK